VFQILLLYFTCRCKLHIIVSHDVVGFQAHLVLFVKGLGAVSQVSGRKAGKRQEMMAECIVHYCSFYFIIYSEI